jgi:hypothetical protein
MKDLEEFKAIGWTIVVLMVILILATFVHAQTATVGVQPNFSNTVSMQDHPQHATEKSLQNDGGTTTASGTLPITDFLDAPKQETPLGDIARYYRTHTYVPLEAK